MSTHYNPKIVTDGLLLAYDAGNEKSYPGSGTDWFNLVPNGYDAVLVNGVTHTSSTHMAFDGANDYAYIKTLNYGGGGATIEELTVSAWFRTSVTGTNYDSGVNVDPANWAFLDFDRSEVFNYYIEGGGQLGFSGNSSNRGGLGNVYYDIKAGTSTLFNDGNWHCGTVTFSVANQEIVFYADGELLTTHTADGNMTALGAGVTRYGIIGDGSEAGSEGTGINSVYYQGDIASVMMYDTKALSAAEVKQNFEATRGRFGI